MAGSFRKIDYRIRPAKTIERRMMAEAFLRLRPFGAVETYRYVGLGSVYFADFALFHSICGFRSMVSIEDITDPVIKQRFEFNAPLGGIKIEFGNTNMVLPRLNWDLRTVVWLDYDGVLEKQVIVDLRYLAGKVVPGSVVAVSVNANLDDEDSEKQSRLEVFQGRIGSTAALPDWVTQAGRISPRELFRLYRDVLGDAVHNALNDRNAGRPEGQKFVAEQIFYFKYQDNTPMFTIGWVFFDQGQRNTFDNCGFSTLAYTSSNDQPFSIDVPLITSAEVREINRCIDHAGGRATATLPIPQSEVAKYERVRRYWPLISNPEIT